MQYCTIGDWLSRLHTSSLLLCSLHQVFCCRSALGYSRVSDLLRKPVSLLSLSLKQSDSRAAGPKQQPASLEAGALVPSPQALGLSCTAPLARCCHRGRPDALTPGNCLRPSRLLRMIQPARAAEHVRCGCDERCSCSLPPAAAGPDQCATALTGRSLSLTYKSWCVSQQCCTLPQSW